MGDLDLGNLVGRLQDAVGGSLLTFDGTSISARSLVELVLVLVAAVWLGG
ncbi:MAG: hypothetical protein U1E45_13190 [Geminicoccaceae bacterium]